MTDLVPADLSFAAPAPRDRRILITAAVSVLVHLVLLALLVLPRLQPEEAGEPPPIAVELVPPSAVPLLAPSSAAPSSELPSAEAPSSASALSSELPSSAVVSSRPPSEVPSSAAPSSAPASDESSEMAASISAASEALASSSAQPIKGARPVVIPVGPSEVSSEDASSAEDTTSASELSSAASAESSAQDSSEAASDESSALTTTDTAASEAIGEDSAAAADVSAASDEPPPPGGGLMHAARRFYLASILDAPGMARAKAAIKQLPPQRRLVQTCNIEAIGQIGNAGKHYQPDALIADAFSKPVTSGTRFSAGGGAFRSDGKWYAISYDCTLSKDLSAVTAFSYHLGEDVTAKLKARGDG